MNEDRFDVIIGGGSFVGLALALGLAKSAPGLFRIAIVERMPAATAKEGRFDGRSVALIPAVQYMLEALGIWERVASDAQPVETIDITDSELEMPVRSALLNFDGEGNTDGPLAFIMENALLRRALYEAADTLGDVQIISPASIQGIALDESGAKATLDNGRTLDARLLVAADGRQSALRKMAGFKIIEWKSGQAAITGTIAHDYPHHGRAVQHFLPSGPFAILPMTGNRSSIVWTERETEARRIMALGEVQQIEEIEKRMGYDLGKLSIAGKLAFYPLAMTLARSFVKPRIALAGDAAHGLHWIAGQGLNHGLKDAAALTEVLTDAARLGLDPGDVSILQRYERWRRFDSASSAMTAAALNRMFANDIMPLRMMRQFGLGVVNRLPVLKGFLKQEAAGLTGELPKLLRGELA
ncbi:MAG TPA: FAD-dependent monooxygenase [Hyphomicrobiales bacterium]|nr:FAD-dependent monooxygenase [Hyphomicrobiales bacterium]